MTKKSSSFLLLLLAAPAFLVGCAVDEPGGSAASLAVCPPGVTEGAICDVDPDLACVRSDAAGDGTICHCERSADSPVGVVVCGSEPPPDPTSFCTDRVATGEHCDPDGPLECRHARDDDVYCRCAPRSDASDCGFVWICDDGSEPPPGTEPCDDPAIRACLDDGTSTCGAEDGRICRCEVTPDGEVHLTCEGPIPPPEPAPCSDADAARCMAGEPVACVYEDGRVCHCDASADGSIRFTCEGGTTDPPVPGSCSDADAMRCLAGEHVECFLDDGRRCFCSPEDPAGSVGFYCEEPTGPGLGDTCTEEHLIACTSGMDVRCTRDGAECFCDITPDGAPALICAR
jgi:hypothetical protein